ncbi:MAG: HAMP domain-containing protein [Deferrisomatales bacterium]
MFKSLAAKAIIPVALSVTCFVVVCSILLYTSMKRDRIDESVLHANDIASVVVKSTRYAMLRDDRETLRNIVSNVSEEVIVDHVRIFNKQGVIVFSGVPAEVGRELDKEAEGCFVCHAGPDPVTTLGPMDQARRFVKDDGKPVLAITAAVYNEPDCFTGACHYHPEDQVVLGTLDIGLSQESLQSNLALMRRRLAFFGVMVLALSVGGVAALLKLNVVAPLQRLVDYVESAKGGKPATAPPPVEEELAAVARAFDRVRGEGRGEGQGKTAGDP